MSPIINPTNPVAQRWEARRAQIVAANGQKKDIRPMLLDSEKEILQEEGFAALVAELDSMVQDAKTDSHW